MVTTWNTQCGIAEYTKYFIENASPGIDFRVWPNKTDENVADGEIVAPRLWETGGDVYALAEQLGRSGPDIVHIQCTGAFFSMTGLVGLIESLRRHTPVVVTLHNFGFMKPEDDRQRAALNTAYFAVHQERDIGSLRSLGIDAARITHIPLGQVAAPERTAERVKNALGIGTRGPVIGSFGFLLRHKGVHGMIRAVAALRKKYPGILYLAVNAVCETDESRQYFRECEALVRKWGLEKHVRIVPDYLEKETSMYLLQACDLFVLPYAGTNEAASGAVRFCIAAGRPLVLTGQPIFNEIKDCAVLIKNDRPASIAKGVRKLLDEGAYAKSKAAVEEAAKKNNWPEIEKHYTALYKKIMEADGGYRRGV
jgi:glycosyltransferase involved in cell wall biosynthesis